MTQQITLYKQIHPQQCPSLAKLGYKSLINLRFDHESDGQPTSQDIQGSADAAGICYHHLPIDGNKVDKELVFAFARLIQNSPKPVMAFCNSGSRAKRLYQSALILGLL